MERQLGQLKQVFPLAYVFKQEKIRPGAQSTATTEGRLIVGSDCSFT